MLNRLAWILVGLSVTVALCLAGYRFWLNWQDRTVDLVLDGRSYRQMARETHVSYEDLLKSLKQSGATAVAVAEQDLASMQEAGLLKAVTGAKLRELAARGEATLPAGIHDGYTYVMTDRADVAARIQRRLPAETVRSAAPGLLEIAMAQDVVAQVTFGFDAPDFEAVQAAGLRPVPRPANRAGVDPNQLLTEVAGLAPEARSVIFQGREVLGYPGGIAGTAEAVKARHWVIGLVEQPSGQGYIVQQGQEELADRTGYRVTRVTAQLDGVTRRGARMLYLKGRTPAEVSALSQQLSGLGYKLGLPGGLSYVRVGRLVTVVLSLALAGVLILISGGHWLVAAVTLLAAVAGPYVAPGAALWAQAGALGLIPVLALLSGPGGPDGDPDAGLRLGWRLTRWVSGGVVWVAATLFSALAAAMVAVALRGAPADLLGITPPPSGWLAVGLAAVGYAGLHTERFRWDATVGRGQLLAFVAVIVSLGAALAFPVVAPALVGLSALGGLPAGAWRQAGLALGFAGAVALAVAPASGALVALAGAGMGLAVYAYHTYRGSVGRQADRGRETA